MPGVSKETLADQGGARFPKGSSLCFDQPRSVHTIDPLQDPRWPEFLERHPRASIFHTPGWIDTLRRTYGYQSIVLTTSSPDQPLENGLAICQVNSWLTGSRLVSLPFSDHCQPLVEIPEHWAVLLREVQRRLASQGGRSFQFRPLIANWPGSAGLAAGERCAEYCRHSLDLRPDVNTLYGRFHKDCIQRKIQRAEREKLACETGRSKPVLGQFYRLLLLTRRRHRIPPQPIAWFRNLIDCAGERATLYVALKDGQPVASILTLFYKRTFLYKYGCSDERFHNLGGMPWLFWRAIQDAKRQGAEEFDLGRSDLDNAGLIAFKDRLGAVRSTLAYYEHPACKRGVQNSPATRHVARCAFTLMPDVMLRAAGALLYRHVG